MQFQRPSLAQEQRLRMNPQMLQSIKLMELPIIELRERIEEELERNPALEKIEEKNTISLPSRKSRAQASDDHRRFIEGMLTRPETLQEHLLRQLQLEKIDNELRTMCETLIQNLDDNGFHKEKCENLFTEPADQGRQNRLDEALKLVQALEPPGCCTTDYREALKVQIAQFSEEPYTEEQNQQIEKILDNLELVEREKFGVLAKKIDLNEEETRRICEYIKKLSPFPGRAFASYEVRFVIPDIKVARDNSGFIINLNDEAFPVLGINPSFKKFGSSADQTARDFARENIREARLFINHLNQRNQTLIRVANAILEFQRSFFINGPKFLAPLTLKDIASELNIHETTVSRTANGKYMQTEWGIYEIRYFFTNSISGSGATRSQYSKESVKEIIRDIIADETRLLSDQDISHLLSQKGIALARRTVAKYRKELDTGSSYTRKTNLGGSK